MAIYRRFEDCSKKEWYKICTWGASEEKVIGAVAYPFDEWSLYTMFRDYVQKNRGWGDAFIAGCVCGNGGECGDGVGGGGGCAHGVGEEKVIGAVAHPFE